MRLIIHVVIGLIVQLKISIILFLQYYLELNPGLDQRVSLVSRASDE
jgi:hypothetical protein